MKIQKLLKRIVKSNAFISLVAALLAGYIRFVGLTTKWSFKNRHHLEFLRGKPVILAFWHSRLMMIPYHTPKKAKANVVISQHGDGDLIARVQEYFGYGSIRGSSRKGGREAVIGIIKAAKRGEAIVITPDGPRGPARKVSGNIVQLSKKLEIPIVPVTCSTTRCKIMNSWDRFMFALPFGRGVFFVGEPIPPENADTLEEVLNKLTDEADFAIKSL